MRKIAAFAGLMLWLGACATAAPEAAAPQAAPAEAAPTSMAGSTEEQEPATLAEAEALLERARADLDRLALNEPGSPAQATAGAAPAPAPPAAAPRAAPSEEKRDDRGANKSAAADEATAPAPKKEMSACETACRAFSSLQRASDAVCRLEAEPSGKRCERAKQIREDAARRVSSCSCK